MTWSDVDWTATEAVVGRIQDRIFPAAKVKRPRLEPDAEQSSCPVLRGLGSGNGARLPDSMATCVQPRWLSHSDRAIRPAVVVAKLATSIVVSPSPAKRALATTVSLWTSRPAHRG